MNVHREGDAEMEEGSHKDSRRACLWNPEENREKKLDRYTEDHKHDQVGWMGHEILELGERFFLEKFAQNPPHLCRLQLLA